MSAISKQEYPFTFSPEVDWQLLEDIYTERPHIEDLLRLGDVKKDTAELLVCATFGKNWYVRINDFEKAGAWRDVQKECFDLVSHSEDLRASVIANILSDQVQNMFLVNHDD